MRPRLALVFLAGTALAFAAETNPVLTRSAADYVPALAPLTRPSASPARELVERFTSDRAELDRLHAVKGSAQHRRRMGEFLASWRTRLEQIEPASLDVDGAIDVALLRTRVVHEQRLLEREAARQTETAPWLPFADALIALPEARRNLAAVDGRAAAEALESVRKTVEPLGKSLEEKLKAGQGPSKVVALRAAGRLTELQRALTEWFDTYNGYDPEFGWWVRDPYKQVTQALEAYGKVLREKVAGIDPKQREEPIVGDPIGRAGLVEELAKELVAYSPEELIALAEREFVWVDRELRRAAADMGLGDDWKAALERVKRDHVGPGQQPALVRDLALEAERYVRERDLVTVPPLAADVWLIKMMPPAQQKVAPFFLGGSDILVAFPTDEMTHEEKVQSLRANNRHFARATVFHELVPGHHLQFWAKQRHNPHRELFTTPFWMEGWALWWELRLWDLGFFNTPEGRIGTLFWRAHRCARIIFSLKFHLGEWTPQQCVDFLVDRVGHERASATGEVRRSFNGQWSPLYQAGYLLGALQIRTLHREFVASGKMGEKAFHDAILNGGPMPIEMVRVRLSGTKPAVDYRPAWRFAE
jgi:hypothetical protein